MIAIGWRCILYNIIKTAELVGLYARIITISFRKSKTALCRTGYKTDYTQWIGGYEALANTQLLDFYKMLKILKLTPMGLGHLTPTVEKPSPLRKPDILFLSNSRY